MEREENETVLTVEAVAHYLAVSTETIHRLIAIGQIPASAVEGEWQIPLFGLAAFLDTQAPPRYSTFDID